MERTGPPLERAISAAGGCKLAPERSEESASSRAAYIAAEAVAHYSLTIKHLYKTAPWKSEGLFLLSIYVSSTSAPRMDHNVRLDWEQNTSSVFPDKVLNRRTGTKSSLGVPGQTFTS